MVLASVFGGSSPRNCPKLEKFEIRLDDDFILIRGHRTEASDVSITGIVVLMISEPHTVKGIKISLQGKWKVGWDNGFHSPTPSSYTSKKQQFLNETTTLYPRPDVREKQCGTLPAGNHEFPFHFTLLGSCMESVEGMGLDNYIVYNLKASIERGYMKQDMHAQKHLRVVRTVGTGSAEELIHPLSVEDAWPEKIAYKVHLPNKTIIFGSPIKVDLELTPLLKGLTLGKVRLLLYEKQELRTTTGKKHTVAAVIESHTMEAPPEALVSGELETDDKYVFQATLQLPQSLKKCRQDIESDPITVEHELKVNVQLHNPDGHVSELQTKFAVKLIISPNHTIGDNHEVSQTLNAGPIDPYEVPPSYDLHTLDDLYTDIDPSGFMTPGVRSGFTTPWAYALSQNASVDNLASLNHVDSTGPSSSVLQARLSSLQASTVHPAAASSMSGTSRSVQEVVSRQRAANGYSNGVEASAPHSRQSPRPGLSRQASQDDEAAPNGDSVHIEYDLEALGRVPTYNTATAPSNWAQRMRSEAAPPTYGDSVSGQPNQSGQGSRQSSVSGHGLSRQNTPPGLQRPVEVHVRSTGPSDTLSERGTTRTTLRVHRPLPHRVADDEETRLRLLRALGDRAVH